MAHAKSAARGSNYPATGAMNAGSFAKTDPDLRPSDRYLGRSLQPAVVVQPETYYQERLQRKAYEGMLESEGTGAASLSSLPTFLTRVEVGPTIDRAAMQTLTYSPPKIEFDPAQLQSMVVLKPDAAGTSVNQQADNDDQACCNCCPIL